MITILGTGQVGRAILDQIKIKTPNDKILLVNKSGRVSFNLPIGTEVLGTNVTIPEKLISIFQNSDIVFSCTDVPYQFWGEFYPLLSKSMVEGLKHSNARLVFADHMYSYGNIKGEFLHENLPHLAKTVKGKIRAEVIDNFYKSGVNDRVAIVKSSDFIGPRIEKGVFGTDFLKSIYYNKTVYLPSNTTLPHHFTFIEDFSKALVLVAFEPNAFNEIWHVPNAKAISQNEWVKIFEHETGLKIKFQSIHKSIIKLVGLFNPFVRELNELSYQFEYPYLVDAQKFINQFGDISTQPSEIVHKTINWFNTYKAIK